MKDMKTAPFIYDERNTAGKAKYFKKFKWHKFQKSQRECPERAERLVSWIIDRVEERVAWWKMFGRKIDLNRATALGAFPQLNDGRVRKWAPKYFAWMMVNFQTVFLEFKTRHLACPQSGLQTDNTMKFDVVLFLFSRR